MDDATVRRFQQNLSHTRMMGGGNERLCAVKPRLRLNSRNRPLASKPYLISLSYRAGENGWLTRDLTYFSTVLQSYQDDGRVTMKGCVQWNFFFAIENIPAASGYRTETARSAAQRLNY